MARTTCLRRSTPQLEISGSRAFAGGGSSPGGSVAAVSNQPRFLVVDDIPVNRLVVRKMLEALNVEVELAEDGAKAVESCRKSKFSVILMDMMMPVMGRVEATRVIRKGEDGQACGRNQTTPIVAVTANPTVEGLAEGKEAAFTHVLVKPVTRKTLFVVIAKWAREEDMLWMRDAWLRYANAQKRRASSKG